ncbi:mitochondrial 54S ribosomal protein YmL41 [Coemansia sp. RSA 1813]|nr:mitochondrial 54S ribosomal protein YmL41 [Coemansia sp. RSA 1646]KAJ1773196.1 mitochondrial 54S ribosomal protein YmL41 [Coemansia sp. RSA 1843]KAJ2092073.1 mitochondrial 54S ribosomal protein YmL41 [Coemansia sp. RSA 986]KAJ2216591.1 mitochondrial 54S ribosomal protein YmL41 [Coemansia sp. RSA 487]KAJ2572126.1 mitochondrial 54S ribosomal protein YmL41 [Coemansia sp. RSA 1813]
MAQRFGNFKVYFPNLVFKIIPDSRLGRNQAAFRVPLQVNKLDIKDYLTHIYNVTVTDVRTTVFPGKLSLNRFTGQQERSPRIKKAIVTIKEDFEYPKEVDVDKDFKGAQVEYQRKRRDNKLKGWRLRPTPALKELGQKVRESEKAKAGSKESDTKKNTQTS